MSRIVEKLHPQWYKDKFHETVRFSMLHQRTSKMEAIAISRKGMKWRISHGLELGEITQEEHDELQEWLSNVKRSEV